MGRNDFPSGIVRITSHRPWPISSRPWVMTQTWHDLLFVHWPVNTSMVRARVPEFFTIEEFDGSAWVSIVPLHMTNVGFGDCPGCPASMQCRS